MIKIAIVEDDQVEAERLNGYLEAYAKKHSNLINTRHFPNGLEFIEHVNQSFDIVFMDIEMPLMNGMEAARKLREVDSTACLIFVTKMAQLAVKGYEVNAFDFLIKPIKSFEFELKFSKALAYCQSLPKDELVLENRKTFFRLDLSKLVYVEVYGHDILFHTKDKVVEAHGALKDYEDKLSRKHFARIAKSYLVNLRYVSAYSKGEVEMINGEKLLVGRAHKKTFVDTLSRYLGEIYKMGD